jgi:Holliday junction resolvasome RuvABC endonuclease subunit
MTVLALDLGTKTGYALGEGATTVSGVWDFKPRRFEGGGMRYLRFRKRLDEINAATPLNTVVFEEVRHHSAVDAAHVYGGLMAHLTAWCEENAVPYAGVPIQTIKRHATGKGNANKEAMIEAARLLGYEPEDDNEADALHLLGYWQLAA